MRVISTNAELSNQLKRLIKKYPHIAIATAWASANTDVFKALAQNEDRIVQGVIGTHFYQTHPAVLDQFIDSAKVRFILQPDGVFHPKVYLFWGSEDWEVIVGSANLTIGALTKNSELSVLVTSGDGQAAMQQDIARVIDRYWKMATAVSQTEAENYRRLWEIKNRDLKKVADLFGDEISKKPAVQSRVMSMGWSGYLDEVKKDKILGFKERLRFLKMIGQYFKDNEHFNDMSLDIRKGIAGLPNKVIKNWGWFGSMKGAMTFGGLINKGHEAFSLALDQIPLTGQITKRHYDSYIVECLRA